MEELISIIAKGLVEDKDAVTVTVGPATEDRTVVYHLHVGPQDMGRVIGKSGKVANSIRTLLRVAAEREGKQATLDVMEP